MLLCVFLCVVRCWTSLRQCVRALATCYWGWTARHRQHGEWRLLNDSTADLHRSVSEQLCTDIHELQKTALLRVWFRWSWRFGLETVSRCTNVCLVSYKILYVSVSFQSRICASQVSYRSHHEQNPHRLGSHLGLGAMRLGSRLKMSHAHLCVLYATVFALC